MFENKIKKKKKTRKIASYFLVVFVQKRKILEFFLGFSCPLRNVTW